MQIIYLILLIVVQIMLCLVSFSSRKREKKFEVCNLIS